VKNLRVEYILDTDGMTEPKKQAACRSALEVIADDAATFETDIPWGMSAAWPPEVAGAAERLQMVSPKRRREPDYGQTGVLTVDSDMTWAAFVAFAPWAFDAGVWSADHVQVASLSDSSDSIVLRLTDTQRAEVEASVGHRLVPVTEWKVRRRRA
jgi:hypothetical protein